MRTEFVSQLPERFASAYKSLLSSDLGHELLGSERQNLSLGDLAYLLSVASRLSLNADLDSELAGAHCQLAYDVAVRIPKFANGNLKVIGPVCEAILSRIGNFPARNLLRRTTAQFDRDIDPYLELEIVVREAENGADDAPEGIILTDFQVRLLSALRDSATVSVSAPTSAGKSFTLELEILNRLKKGGPYVAIFLVPTRALIRQVSLDLMRLLKANDIECSVLSSLSIPEDGKNAEVGRYIFVLTQERFATFLAEAKSTLSIDAVIVDEAQEIGKDRRGITLERVVRLATRQFPSAQLFFSSPLRSNPEYLLSLFNRMDASSAYFVEHQRPVTQNIISIKLVKGSTSSATIDVISDFGSVNLGQVDLPFKFRGRYLSNFVKHFTKPDDVSIVYCNRPSEADKIAKELSDTSTEIDDEELNDFGQFLEHEVHRFYRLGKMVRRGIAFHYANIPQIVRSRTEELAKDRKLRFICCTSTLLQGVNLPAKNIFLENPKTGRGALGQIKPGDFWNLVGRAGRMNQEFSGNVFCIYGQKKWDSNPFDGDRMMPIESAFQVALTERSAELAFWATKPALSSDGKEAWAEQAFANVYADYVDTGTRLSDTVEDASIRANLAIVDAASEKVYAKRTLENELFTFNMYVHPERLEELAAHFRAADDILVFCPVQPFARDAYKSVVDIFGVIDQIFIKAGNERHRYFAFLALDWMRGKPIRDLVEGRLKYKNIQAEETVVNEEIRDLFREIEEEIRYRYVKYTSIYLKVLSAVLIEKGMKETSDKLLPLNMFLEFGASDKALINLMSLGLSRTSAIYFKRIVSMRDDWTLSECSQYLSAINLSRIDIPKLCKAEISRIQAG
jgi:hypothetical protein